MLGKYTCPGILLVTRPVNKRVVTGTGRLLRWRNGLCSVKASDPLRVLKVDDSHTVDDSNMPRHRLLFCVSLQRYQNLLRALQQNVEVLVRRECRGASAPQRRCGPKHESGTGKLGISFKLESLRNHCSDLSVSVG